MQRRIVSSETTAATTVNGQLYHQQQASITNGSSINTTNGIRKGKNINSSKSNSLCSVWTLLLIVIILTICISFFPDERKMMIQSEQQLEQIVYNTEQQFVKEHSHILDPLLRYIFPSSVLKSTTSSTTGSTIYDADRRMQLQSSKWVDGEKKLKAGLQILVERQQKGLDLGVPVLTRYLNDETIPYFFSKDDPSLNRGIATVDEWNTLVQQKYEQMRIEENQWREQIQKVLLQEKENRG